MVSNQAERGFERCAGAQALADGGVVGLEVSARVFQAVEGFAGNHDDFSGVRRALGGLGVWIWLSWWSFDGGHEVPVGQQPLLQRTTGDAMGLCGLGLGRVLYAIDDDGLRAARSADARQAAFRDDSLGGHAAVAAGVEGAGADAALEREAVQVCSVVVADGIHDEVSVYFRHTLYSQWGVLSRCTRRLTAWCSNQDKQPSNVLSVFDKGCTHA